MAEVMQATESDSLLSEYYLRNGYVVVEGLIPTAKIDALVRGYEAEILPSKAKFFRQNTNVYDVNRLTPSGHVVQNFLDIHHYKRFPKFRQLALDIYFSDEMLSALPKITGSPEHNLMQSMLFDANTETVPHQDWWYLDTVPNGHLLGAWIALEDIYEDAGRFFVMPGTHEVKLHKENMPHSEWLAVVKKYFDENRQRVSTPALKKGDVLFWNSRTIHGALPKINPARSRRSLTAHYMPSHMAFGNLFTTKPWINYENYRGFRYFSNQPEHSLKAEVVTKLKIALYDSPKVLKLLRKFQKKAVSEI